MRLTLGNLKYTPDGRPSRLITRLNMCATDPRIADFANAFQERALSLGRWWGSTQLVRFCLGTSFSGCLTLPREVATVEAVKINGSPANIRNQWYDFVAPHTNCSTWNNGGCDGNRFLWNPFCDCGCGCEPMDLLEQGTACCFQTTTTDNQKLRFYPGDPSDNGKTVIVQGFDKNGVWVRRDWGDGIIRDGEKVALNTSFADTQTIWAPGQPQALIFERTNYRKLMYAVDVTTSEEIACGEYQASETNPSYRQVRIPQFKGRCGCSSNSSHTTSLTAIVSLDHIPVVDDTDWLLFENLESYSDGVMSEKLRESGDIVGADALFFGVDRAPRNARGVLRKAYGSGALPLLEAMTRKMTGDKTSVAMSQSGFVQPIF